MHHSCCSKFYQRNTTIYALDLFFRKNLMVQSIFGHSREQIFRLFWKLVLLLIQKWESLQDDFSKRSETTSLTRVFVHVLHSCRILHHFCVGLSFFTCTNLSQNFETSTNNFFLVASCEMKSDIFCGDGCSKILEKEVHCFCNPFNYCVIVRLQKRKDDLKINNYFILIYNELELLILRKKEEDN